MKNKKGIALPLTIIMVVYMMMIGGIMISIGNSSQRVAYGNMVKMQSYYLAKSGVELGNAFLYTPSDLSNPSSNNWFELGNTITTDARFEDINQQLKIRTGEKPDIQEVYIETQGDKKIPHIYPKNFAGSRAGEKLGEVAIQIQLVDTKNTGLAKDCIYRITSQATLSRGKSINHEYKLQADIRVTNQFDKKLY